MKRIQISLSGDKIYSGLSVYKLIAQEALGDEVWPKTGFIHCFGSLIFL